MASLQWVFSPTMPWKTYDPGIFSFPDHVPSEFRCLIEASHQLHHDRYFFAWAASISAWNMGESELVR